MADIYPESRVEEILVATIDGTEYTEYPQSRIEQLLIELKAVIEAGGGGGGGTTNYNLLENKPAINGTTLTGDKSLSDLGITQEIKKVMDMLAGQFSSEEAYTEGQIVIYNKILYQFTTDHAAGDFNPLEVEQTSVEELLSGIYALIPTSLSALTEDSTHRTVTDSEKSAWNGKQSALPVTVSGDDVTFSGTITDGEGNELKEVESLEVSASGNPIIVNAVDVSCKELVETLEPIQDLHGYDYPWAGGAGKNLLPMTVASLKANNTLGTWSGNTYTLNSMTFTLMLDADNNVIGIKVNGTASANTSFIINPSTNLIKIATGNIYLTISDNVNGSTYNAQADIYVDGSYVKTIQKGSTNYPTHQFNGTNISVGTARIFLDSGANISNATFKIQIEIGSSATTFSPYTNICPISGRTGSSVVAYGRNVWDGEIMAGGILPNGTVDTSQSYASSFVSKNIIPIEPNTNYYVSKNSRYSGKAAYYVCYDKTGTLVTTRIQLDSNNIFTSPSNAYGLRIYIFDALSLYQDDICVNVSDHAFNGQYVPYVGRNTATLTFGTTVYGGQVDFKTGKVRVTHKMVTIDNVNKLLNFATSADYGAYARISDTTDCKVDSSKILGLCSKARYVSFNDRLNATKEYNRVWNDTNNNTVFVRAKYDANVQTVNELYSIFENAQVCYELATPIELTLSPANLTLLKGYNYITGDGNIDLVYIPESISGYAESILVPISLLGTNESGRTTASRAYTSGEYFYQNGKMYKATTSIASGATFTVGTNCVQTTLFAELQPNTYDSTEVLVGKWGSANLYRKTVSLGALPNSTSKSFALGLTTETVRRVEVYYNNNAEYGSVWSEFGSISYNKSTKKLDVYSTTDMSGYTGTAIVEYTK